MRMTWKKRGSIAVLAAVSSIGLVTSVAQAGTDASASVPGAKGYFGAYGEHLVATDTVSDAHPLASTDALVVVTILPRGEGRIV